MTLDSHDVKAEYVEMIDWLLMMLMEGGLDITVAYLSQSSL